MFFTISTFIFLIYFSDTQKFYLNYLKKTILFIPLITLGSLPLGIKNKFCNLLLFCKHIKAEHRQFEIYWKLLFSFLFFVGLFIAGSTVGENPEEPNHVWILSWAWCVRHKWPFPAGKSCWYIFLPKCYLTYLDMFSIVDRVSWSNQRVEGVLVTTGFCVFCLWVLWS